LLYLRQKQLLEESEMSALFPTFSNWVGQVKRFLASDASDIWQRLLEDDQRYQQELQAKGIDYLLSI
jgi:hypothetical protein